jgi:O-antigen ligase
LISIDNPKIIQSHFFNEDERIFIKKEYLKDDIVVTYQKKFSYLNGCNTHPHNLHLQVLSEIGLIGYLFFGIFIIYLVILLFKNYKNRNNIKFYREQYCLIISILINLFPLIPSGNFFNNWMNFLFYLPIGFLIYFIRKND